METKAVKPVSSPLDEANFISRWTVYWMSALLAKGNVKKLDENDMYPLPKNYDADKLGLQFEQKWTGSVLGTMRALHYWEAVNIIPSFLILSVAATFSPFFVQGFIRVLSNRAPLLGLTNGWVLIALLIISGIVQAFTINYGFLLSTMLATKVRAQMANAIFRKSVRLSSASRASLNAGDVLNLMSQDTERLFFAGLLINTLWWSCLMLVIILIVLITQIGIAGLASVLFAVCLLPLTAKIAEWTGVWKRRMLKHTDERVSFSSEVFQGIATIKMQGWEDQVGEKVFDYRRKEMVFGHKVHRLLAVNAFQVFAVPAIMTATCFGVLIGTRPQGLDVSTVYTVLAFINTLLLPLDLIPRAAGTFAQAMVSVRRIEAFMKLKEVPSTYLHHEPCAEGLALEMENCSFFWMRRKDQEPKHHAKMKLKRLQSLRASFRGFQDKQPKKSLVAAQSEMEKVTVLSSINLQVKMGELCVIVGRVGSGKTSLLAGILGEIEREPGGIVKQAPNFKFVAYAPQEPWIQNATVKNNILFSLSKRQEHAQKKDGAVDAIYERVIDCVEMEVDLSTLPKRDETEIGSRGINLSGGQKARVGLGRALYHALSSSPQSCLIVLDDPFAALDPKVAASVWTKTVEGCLKADTRVVALSSNLHLASRADRIVVMEEGKIVGIGSPEEVLNDAKFAWLFDARNATNKEDEELEEVTQHHSVVFDEREVITLPFDEMNDRTTSPL